MKMRERCIDFSVDRKVLCFFELLFIIHRTDIIYFDHSTKWDVDHNNFWSAADRRKEV